MLEVPQSLRVPLGILTLDLVELLLVESVRHKRQGEQVRGLSWALSVW